MKVIYNHRYNLDIYFFIYRSTILIYHDTEMRKYLQAKV